MHNMRVIVIHDCDARKASNKFSEKYIYCPTNDRLLQIMKIETIPGYTFPFRIDLYWPIYFVYMCVCAHNAHVAIGWAAYSHMALRWRKRHFQHFFRFSLDFALRFYCFYISRFATQDGNFGCVCALPFLAHRKDLDLPSASSCAILLFSPAPSSTPSLQVENLEPQSEIFYLCGIGNNNKKSVIKVNECLRTSRNYVSECFVQANRFFFSLAVTERLCLFAGRIWRWTHHARRKRFNWDEGGGTIVDFQFLAFLVY